MLGLPTGSSPVLIYKILVERYKAGAISFAHVVTFNMDEYIGIPRDHPSSYHTFMYTHLFSHIDIPPQNVHLLSSENPSPEAECVRYEALIASYGGIDLFLAGIGPDGHIAFNEPGSSLASRTRVKTLAYDTILANSRFFGGDLEKVPRMALTVGVQTVLEAREVVVIITGAHKALALQKCIEGGVNHMWTLSSLQLHPHPMIVVDEDATLELQVKTVRYFKSIEEVARGMGFEQILPSAVRTGTGARMGSSRARSAPVENINSPTSTSPTVAIAAVAAAPKPLTSSLLKPSPATEYPLRATTPELMPDSMNSRLLPGPSPSPGLEMEKRPVGLNREESGGDGLVPDSMGSRLVRTPEPAHAIGSSRVGAVGA